MFYIVETEGQIEKLYHYGRFGCYLELIVSNDNFHPKLTDLVAVYIRPLVLQEGFIIPVSHSEGLNIVKNRIIKLLEHFKVIYVLDRKHLLYHFNLRGITDISLLYSMTYFKKLELKTKNSTYSWFYNRHGGLRNINQLIPLSKLYEKCESTFSEVEAFIKLPLPRGFEFYNTVATNVFFLLEQTGVRVDRESFINMFTPRNPEFSMDGETVYTHYNLYNTTSRPTNAFNAVNFAAIPKDIQHRQVFNPQNDEFVEMDFDGYHIRLICEQLGYELTSESAHRQLGKLYFGKEHISEEEYSRAKQINFQTIYGNIPEEYKGLEISKRLQNFINNTWESFQKGGEVLDPISEKPFTTELQDMYPQKLMNYLVQSMETSRNIQKLVEIFRYLRGKSTKVVLYTYDSIILDVKTSELGEVVEGLQSILEDGGRYPVKVRRSKNLAF